MSFAMSNRVCVSMTFLIRSFSLQFRMDYTYRPDCTQNNEEKKSIQRKKISHGKLRTMTLTSRPAISSDPIRVFWTYFEPLSLNGCLHQASWVHFEYDPVNCSKINLEEMNHNELDFQIEIKWSKKGSLFIPGMILLHIICAVDIDRHPAAVATFLSTYNIMVGPGELSSTSYRLPF